MTSTCPCVGQQTTLPHQLPPSHVPDSRDRNEHPHPHGDSDSLVDIDAMRHGLLEHRLEIRRLKGYEHLMSFREEHPCGRDPAGRARFTAAL
jgi:hypothetical protein